MSKNEIRKSRTKERRKIEHEQKKRIRARAKEEKERERRLVLEGKVKLTKKHLKDPILKIHRDLLAVEKKASTSVSPNRKRMKSPKPIRRKASKTRSSAAVRFKWSEVIKKSRRVDAAACASSDINGAKEDQGSSVIGKVEGEIMEDLSDLNKTLDDYEETVIANLIYDEANDNIRTVTKVNEAAAAAEEEEEEEEEEETDEEKQRKLLALANPVKSAFEGARGVDDLFRIAEIWVNPTDYEIG